MFGNYESRIRLDYRKSECAGSFTRREESSDVLDYRDRYNYRISIHEISKSLGYLSGHVKMKDSELG
jgi:hypothetical protein